MPPTHLSTYANTCTDACLSLSVCLSVCLSLSLPLCFALGLGGWADPIPRSVERPHPVILTRWARLYKSKECGQAGVLSIGLVNGVRVCGPEAGKSLLGKLAGSTGCTSFTSELTFGLVPSGLLLYLTRPHLPDPCLHPEQKPGSPHCLDLPLNPEPGPTQLTGSPVTIP